VKQIGIFDSGLGGLSVWREIVRQWRDFKTVYVADQIHIPYGPRDPAEILDFARGITRFLLAQGCDIIVVACNAASAASLATLRLDWPQVPFVGMEPAVKPAVAVSRTRVAAVLATPATLQGALFATTVERFASDVQIVRQVCPGLVEQIESGDVDGPRTRALLQEFLAPSLRAGADTIVLACTHYPFVRHTIEALAGPGITVIDPAPAVARQVGRVAGARLPAGGAGADAGAESPLGSSAAQHSAFYTTGQPAAFDAVASRLVGLPLHAQRLRWSDGIAGQLSPA